MYENCDTLGKKLLGRQVFQSFLAFKCLNLEGRKCWVLRSDIRTPPLGRKEVLETTKFGLNFPTFFNPHAVGFEILNDATLLIRGFKSQIPKLGIRDRAFFGLDKKNRIIRKIFLTIGIFSGFPENRRDLGFFLVSGFLSPGFIQNPWNSGFFTFKISPGLGFISWDGISRQKANSD